ncbi:hypothetical protein pEaSNUABM54_00018 [Erwinia phage pEa_SNUABM_54]|nr:hypothetical protein pEaSNUABM54_00018 [Erwinia phage pEa_SNUABM_54]
MQRVFIVGDGHVSHKNICKQRPQFSSVAEHDEFFWDLLSPLTKRDQLIMAGDMFFTRESLYKLRKFPFRKILVMGNHCTDHEPDFRDLVEVYDDIHESIKKNWFTITHRPMHPAALRKRINVHAHQHGDTLPDSRYINVSLEATGFRLVDFEEIRSGDYRTHASASKF